jgi:hypothetical protein
MSAFHRRLMPSLIRAMSRVAAPCRDDPDNAAEATMATAGTPAAAMISKRAPM